MYFAKTHAVKHHRGRLPGIQVWVVGLVERSSNRLLLYPVQDRSASTLESLLLKHVALGSSIFSDGWAGYCNLNALGYQHFTVFHKEAFTQTFKNVTTGETKTVHTNTIEGAWMHARKHFAQMNGTFMSQFDGHLVEIMFRNMVATSNQGTMYDIMFRLMQMDAWEGPLPLKPNTLKVFWTWASASPA